MLAEGAWTIVSGEFDPLTCTMAGQIEKLKREGSRLLVMVRTNANELLDANARAIVMAGLRSVDAVFVQNADGRALSVPDHANVTVIDFTVTDRRTRQIFEELVLSREQHVTRE